MQGYKQLLIELHELQGQSGEAAFERITRMVALKSDREFIKNECGGNELKAIDILNSLCQDLFESYHVLAEMLGHFPDKEAWKHGKLSNMRHLMIREMAAAERASKGKPKELPLPRDADVIKQLPKPLRSQVSAVLSSAKRETAATRQVVAKQQQEIDYRKQEQEAVRDECLALREDLKAEREKLKATEERLSAVERAAAAKDREIAALHRRIEALEGQRSRKRELVTN